LRFIIHNANQLLTMTMIDKSNQLGLIEHGSIIIEENKITRVCSANDIVPKIDKHTQVFDASGCVVSPGLIDSHTHPVFIGSRECEFGLRIKGATYTEISQSGGGIRSTVAKVRDANLNELVSAAKPRLDRLMKWGTTTIEAKSGYGLNLETEVKMLEAIKILNQRHPIELIPTFLGAHEFPNEYRENHQGYIDHIINEMLPYVAKQKLAEYCDVFCEEGWFNYKDSKTILQQAKSLGLGIRLHADEFKPSKAARLAVELDASSADHLAAITDEDITLLANSNVVATLMPSTILSVLGKQFAPARKLIDAGVTVALATDLNPGSSMVESLPIVMSLACMIMRMTPEEAWLATTINAARAINRTHIIGSLEQGKQADICIWKMPSYSYLPYHIGFMPEVVIKNGEVIYF
jgi:imidazolonepropionase